ncbi:MULTISPECIES: HPr family phosphocarrier protein [unclassified Clostridium]|jgi:phosphotransferase system HPr (HPr) family protein|uniref:HPr family phosphocarrier protein n=1 Tax=Clostridia TaxID=186801 RepID=UPI0008219FE3|nr:MULTISPECIES: HPr family phosphocarrier protein [unclassified Clostridium]SCJ49700.1 Catabolite repression HPr [uncultured Clostridium sp.]
MLEREITINNKEGLSSRPAAVFVQAANQFSSQILIKQGNQMINAKSIMGVLSLGVARSNAVTLIVKGEDEKEAMDAMVKLIENDFVQA